MYFENPIREWQIIKYKQIKRDGRVEEPVLLVLDQGRKCLKVYFRNEELEQVYYNMEVTKYPILRFSDLYLYILFNGQGQGFRLTFHPKQKEEFVGIMRRLAYISESPAKRRMFNESVLSTHHPPHRRDLNSTWSHSQPCSSSMPPPKRLARNLNFTYHASPFSRPESSASSTSESSRTSRMSVFSQQSRPESSSTCDSLDPFNSPKIPVKRPETANKCVQTEENGQNLLEKLAGDKDFAMGCLKKLMEKKKFGELVAMMRDQIRNMSDNEKETFEKTTRPEAQNVAKVVLKLPEKTSALQNPSTSSTSQKPNLLRRQTSDLEYDVFDERNDM